MSINYQDPQAPPTGQPSYQQPPPGYPPPGYPPYRQDPLTEQLGPSSLGTRPNIAAAVSYFWIIGLIFLLTERKSRFVRFHALQALMWGAISWILSGAFWPAPFFRPLGGLFSLIWLVIGIIAAVRAYRGRWYKIPVIGDIAYKHAMTWNPPEAGPPGNGPYPPQQGQWPQK